MNASLVATAALGSHPRLDAKSAAKIASENRMTMVRLAFPYLDFDETHEKEVDFDAYFDELDALEAQHEAQVETADKVGDEGRK